MLRMLARDRKVTVFTREGGREGGREREREDVRNMLASSKGVVDSCCSAVITLSLSLSHWLKTTIGKQKLSLNFFSQFDSSQFVFLSFSHSISISLLIMNGLSLDSWEC